MFLKINSQYLYIISKYFDAVQLRTKWVLNQPVFFSETIIWSPLALLSINGLFNTHKNQGESFMSLRHDPSLSVVVFEWPPLCLPCSAPRILRKFIFAPNFSISFFFLVLWQRWNWAAKQQTSWVIAPWWFSVSLWRICITFVWPSSTFCIDNIVPCFLDVIPFLSLDVAIFVVLQPNISYLILLKDQFPKFHPDQKWRIQNSTYPSTPNG